MDGVVGSEFVLGGVASLLMYFGVWDGLDVGETGFILPS